MEFNQVKYTIIKIVCFWPIILVISLQYAKAQDCQQLKVGATFDWLPISYNEPHQPKPQGIALDLIRHIGKKLKIPMTINAQLPWKRVLGYLKSGKIDLTPAIYYTTTRNQFYQYTIPYFESEARVFVLKGQEFPFNKLEDLIGRYGGNTHGGSFGEEYDAMMLAHPLNTIEVLTTKQLVSMLLTGRTEYFVYGNIEMSMYLKQQNIEHKIVALPHPVSHSNIHLALSRQSSCTKLIPRINTIIKQAKQNGTLQRIIDKYIANTSRNSG